MLKLTESQGIPLQAVLDSFARRGWVVDWCGLLEDALALRWNASTALARVEEATLDVLGRGASREIAARLRRRLAEMRGGGLHSGPPGDT